MKPLAHPVPLQPFLDWCDEREATYERALRNLGESHAHIKAVSQLLDAIGWGTSAGTRRLHRWRNAKLMPVAERDDIAEALDHAGVSFEMLYPNERIEDNNIPGDEEYCWSCRAFVSPVVPDYCPWCEAPIERVDLTGLPPREQVRQEVRPVSLVVKSKPRRPQGTKEVIYDTHLWARRGALQIYADTGSWSAAGREAMHMGATFSGAESAATSLKNLVKREGWDGREGIARALRDGTWKRRRPPLAIRPYKRQVLTEAQMHEALWLYLYDELSFTKVAERLLSRSSAKNVVSLKNALNREWDNRGWPRRTARSSGILRGYSSVPDEARRCRARIRKGAKRGKRCERWAISGNPYCAGHDPKLKTKRVQYAKLASDESNADAVDVTPFGYWIRRQAQELGSVAAVHRKVNGSISYDAMMRWAHVWSESPGHDIRATRVRRSTVDRILAAWGDGTTFEDVFFPVVDDDEGRAG